MDPHLRIVIGRGQWELAALCLLMGLARALETLPALLELLREQELP